MSTGSLAKKMVAAMHDIDAVTKSGVNQKQGYKYVKAADVANEVRKVLVKHGIAFGYSVLDERMWEKQTNGGGIMFFCSLRIAATFTDQESGEAATYDGIGWGADSLEKAPYKAMTGALKYVLRMTFLIPDEEDPENEKKDAPDVVADQKPSVKYITATQAEQFRNACKENGKEPEAVKAALHAYKIDSSAKIPATMYDIWMGWARNEEELPS